MAAAYTGSGKYIKIQTGRLSFGSGTSEYANIRPTSYTRNGVTYYGIQDYTSNYIWLSWLEELTIRNYKGYSGIIRMYTNFTTPNRSVILFDLDAQDIADIKVAYTDYRFVHGICVGPV